MSANVDLEQAYAACRAIAKREAKNFYYAFLALPAEKRNAMCAIYAYMRKADDLADDESIALGERRLMMRQWRVSWSAFCAGGESVDPVFVATRDAIERFRIPLSLFEELVDGTQMDLEPRQTEGPESYATFDELYRYCYLVASVVGLVCIRVFGYSDARAEKLAEETGVAFQLTNILRDVVEDAERRRVYLPQTDLATHGVELDSILAMKMGTAPTADQRALFAAVGARAEAYYQSAKALMPLIDRESRPALWVLVTIYHGLLKRIQRAGYDVATERASVPTWQKVSILLVGVVRCWWARVF